MHSSDQNQMNTIFHKTLLFIFVIIFPLSSSVAKEPVKMSKKTTKITGFLYGLGFSTSNQIYKGYNQRTMLLPLIGYQGENLTLFGPFISYKIKTFNKLKVSVKLSPRFQGFNASDSDFFQGMKERKSSMDAGIDLTYKQDDWQINISSMFDILNRSNGYEIKSAVSRMYRFGPVFVQPSASVSFLDSRMVNYYYGVSESEINPQRTAYLGQKSQNIALGLSISTPLFLGGYTRLNIEHLWFDANITNSPLVEGNSSLSLQLFFTRNF